MTARQRSEAEALWSFLDAQKSPADRQRATRLARNGTEQERIVALAVLGRFPEQDATWEELVVALRDPSTSVREVAGVALIGMPARPVRWTTRGIASLRELIGGTNVEVTEELLQVLVATKIDPSLAAPLLRNNTDWLGQHLRAANWSSSSAAHLFLRRMNGGVDVGSAERWAEWMRALPAAPASSPRRVSS